MMESMMIRLPQFEDRIIKYIFMYFQEINEFKSDAIAV
jgi:hypothetical protein